MEFIFSKFENKIYRIQMEFFKKLNFLGSKNSIRKSF